MKDAIEGWLDDKIGKTGRKTLEQAGHFLMAGSPAFLAVNWLPDGLAWQIPAAILIALLGIPAPLPIWLNWGASREYFQNVGDAPDDGTLIVIARVPVNRDLLVDTGAYGSGGVAAGFLGFVV